MSLAIERARRGRPPARNEILRAGRLGGADPQDLVRRFGSPLFVYDLTVIDRQVAALQSALPPVADLAFAVKANPALAIVAHLGRLGLGADVASAGELATAIRASIEPGRIVMTGPGKRDDELQAAVAAGIRAVTVESPGELVRLETIAARVGRRVPIMLRAAVTEDARLERVRLVGDDGAGKFGMDAASILQCARRAADSPWLDLLGLHAFGASNVLDAGALVEHVAATGRAARRLAQLVGTTVRLVDAGGGLGIPYESHEESLDLVGLGQGLTEITGSWAGDPLLSHAKLLLEPGRFLVGPAGAYLTTAVDRKTIDGSTIVILDGGVHHLLRPALVGQEHRIRAVSGAATLAGSRLGPVTVAGPLCSGLDVFSQHAVMGTPEVGDLLAILDVGAYGFTESMPLFLSHPSPAEVVVHQGEAALIRPRHGSTARSMLCSRGQVAPTGTGACSPKPDSSPGEFRLVHDRGGGRSDDDPAHDPGSRSGLCPLRWRGVGRGRPAGYPLGQRGKVNAHSWLRRKPRRRSRHVPVATG
ncbi:MAG: hypothetical protein HW391_730 [Chloroflexi bacterium]|nr:hypothetical protein [Chloroflexota bacterium]